jgi:uncharacterized protein
MMGALTERIRAELTAAMKSRDTQKTSVLRMVQAALKNEQIEKGHELSDEEAQTVIRRAVKQRHDSVEQFEKGGRSDRAAAEREEITVLEAYLPQQKSEAEVEAIVRGVVEEVGATSRRESGKVMKEVMARHKGELDGRKVQEILGRILPEG